MRYDAGRDGHPERLRFSVELSKQYTSLSPHRARLRIDADALHQRKVNDEAAVTNREAGVAVPPATHGEKEAIVLGELHGRDDVGHASASRYKGRETIDRSVPHLASILLAGVLRAEQLAPEPLLQPRDVQCSHRRKFRSVCHGYHSSLPTAKVPGGLYPFPPQA